ncbi:hypothetical protein C8R47DRAFT_591714 [Mycena vitilis]|nr:hypothetical protein C8R47DRAFT_591714 [Mycena vitilis]
MSDSGRYSRLLLHKGHGYPVFCPQPSDDLPEPVQRTGVRIGDVGVVTFDGSFDVIFNVCVPANDSVNRFGVPEGFTQLHISSGEKRLQETHHRPGASVSNTEIRKRRLDLDLTSVDNIFLPVGAGARVEILTHSKEAAILLLPDGGSRCEARPKDRFRSYALQHAQSWYTFVNATLHRMIDSGDLYFITGCDKSSSWSLAVAQNRSEETEMSLRLSATQIGSVGAKYAWDWEDTSGAANSGPRGRSEEEEWKDNQTLFIRGFRVSIRSPPLSVLKGPSKVVSIENSKPKDLFRKSGFRPFSQGGSDWSAGLGGSGSGSSGAPSDNGVSVEPIEEGPKPYHPATAINEYLLATSNTFSVAITHDEDWMCILTQVRMIDSEILRRILEQYDPALFSTDGVYLRNKVSDRAHVVRGGGGLPATRNASFFF